MTTFVWTIQSLSVVEQPEPMTVVLSGFTVTGDDAGITAQTSGVTQLLPADPNHFTPFDQITQAQAVEWTQAALGPDGVAAAQATVQYLIDQKKIPEPQPANLPWGT